MRASDLISEDPTIAGVNIVPVIDLCLVLLIILMVTSPLLETADIPVKLPQAITIESKERNVAITLATDGRWAFNSDVVPEEEIIPLLRASLREDPKMLVIIRVDQTSPYRTLTDLIARCKKAGASNISIGIEQKFKK
jgi:biopolymer transport protein ExbD